MAVKTPTTGKRHKAGQIASLIQFGRIGRRALMESARLAAKLDPSIVPVIDDWDRMKPPLQNAVDLDTLCEAHGVEPAHFIAVVGEAAMKYGNNSAILIAALQFPDVIIRSVRAALESDGFKDREALMKHTGFLPVPGTINQAAAKAEAKIARGRPLPRFETTMKQTDRILRNNE